MKIIIIYFSGTGNTKFLSEKIFEQFNKKGFPEVQLLSVENAMDVNMNFCDDNVILGIGFPVYDYMPPEIIMKFIDKLGKSVINNKAFVYSTYTTNPLDSNYYVIDTLQKKGFHVIAQNNFKAPGASAYFYSNPKLPIVKGKTVFSNGVDKRIGDFVNNILSYNSQNQKTIPIRYNRFNKFHIRFSKMTFGYKFYRNLRNSYKCINCGLCVKNCPSSNLYMEDGILHIRNENDCMRCLRCVQICGRDAINFTSSKRRGKYTRKDIENAYENSIIQK